MKILFQFLMLLIACNCLAKNIVVIEPHPDDALLMNSGIINCAINDGDRVKVVVVGNGDYHGKEAGYAWLSETIKALSVLGLKSDDIYFLGFRDATLLTLYENPNENRIIYLTDFPENWNYSYGLPDHPDYFTNKFGTPALLTRKNLQSAIESILREELPETIYTSGLYDLHRDHRGVKRFVVDAIVKIKRDLPSWSPKLYEDIIHSTDGDNKWPVRNLDVNQIQPFTSPLTLEDQTPLLWSRVRCIPVPLQMLGTPTNNPAVNLKYKAISCYGQRDPFLYSFIKSDEIFWIRDFANIALLSTVTVSSENTSTTQLGIKAASGQIDSFWDEPIYHSYPFDYTKKWVSLEKNTAWIQLTWNREYLVDKIILYDRIRLDEWMVGGILYFSDGTSLKVEKIANNGVATPIVFPPKRISWVKLVITDYIGSYVGLTELEVYPANLAKYASVTVSSENVQTGQTKDKAIDGNIDGAPFDPTKEWVTTGQTSGAWLNLTWQEPHLIDRVILYDRPCYDERITKGTLTFSDGSSIPVTALSNNGTGNTFMFPPRNINWLKFTVDEASGHNTGLAEIEVFEAR